MSAYRIIRRPEHCHRCKRFDLCVVRINDITTPPRKTSLCADCASKEWS